MDTVTLKDTLAEARSPEGQAARISVADLVARLAPQRMDTCGAVLPDGVKAVFSRGPVTVWVHQTPPRVFNLKWIAEGSGAPFGGGTRYRDVRLALPYLIVFAVFAPGENGWQQLGHSNECFFRNAPLESVDDELFYPALLNASKFHPQEGRPLAWICTQHLDRQPLVSEPDANKRLRKAFRALMHCLLETGFNYSSEHHEGASWFSESTRVDKRLATVEKWQEASAKDPLFVLDVPWLKTKLTVGQVADRIFTIHRANKAAVASSGDVARLIFNHAAPS
jgi:hypothetical protein